VKRLAEFQLEALKHALSFPQVQFVSYSTCSVHVTENEAVVAEALRCENSHFSVCPSWLVRRLTCSWCSANKAEWKLVHALPEWTKRRGLVVEGLCGRKLANVVVVAMKANCWFKNNI